MRFFIVIILGLSIRSFAQDTCVPCSLLAKRGDTALFNNLLFTGHCAGTLNWETSLCFYKNGLLQNSTRVYAKNKRVVNSFYKNGKCQKEVLADSTKGTVETTWYLKGGRERTREYKGTQLISRSRSREIDGRKKGDFLKEHYVEWDSLGHKTENSFFREYIRDLKPNGYETNGRYFYLRENGKPCFRRKKTFYRHRNDCIKYIDWW